MATVLILDDEPLVGMIIDELLNELGFEGINVATAEAAFSVLSRCDYAVLDLHLRRDTNSLAVAKKLRELQKPFIFLTGDTYRIIRGFEDIPKILKPLSKDRFVKVIEDNFVANLTALNLV